MSKLYYLFIVLLISVQVNAQSDSSSTEKTGKTKQLSIISQQTAYIMNECKKIAESALTETPNPIETISTEGRLKGDPIKTATQLSIKDFNKIYSLGLVYNITRQKKFLDKAVLYLTAWAKVNKPKGNPIDDTNLDPALEGYKLIKFALSKEDDKIIAGWLGNISQEEFKSFLKSQGKESLHNNWNSHRLKIMGEIAFYTDQPAQQELVTRLLKEQLAANLLPDGSSIDFKLRDALHYHVYDLEPLLKLAIVIKRSTGFDFYSYQTESGASLKKSVEWLVPYMNGEKTHGEFVNSTVKFDQDRAKNGEAGYQKGTLFEPAMGLRTLALAGYFEPSYDELYKKLKGDVLNDADWQMLYRLLILQ